MPTTCFLVILNPQCTISLNEKTWSYFELSVIFQHWDGATSCNPPSWEMRIHLLHMVNIFTDRLAKHEDMSSEAIALTYIFPKYSGLCPRWSNINFMLSMQIYVHIYQVVIIGKCLIIEIDLCIFIWPDMTITYCNGMCCNRIPIARKTVFILRWGISRFHCIWNFSIKIYFRVWKVNHIVWNWQIVSDAVWQ